MQSIRRSAKTLFLSGMAGMLLAGTAAAQVHVVTPDADRRAASAATTIMLDPFYLVESYDPLDVYAIAQGDGSHRFSHPEAGMNFFSASVRPDGSLDIGCETMSGYAAGTASRAYHQTGEEEGR